MVKIHAVFHNITPATVFDVLHDPDYRKEWDEHMLASVEIGYLNPNNDVGYYACKLRFQVFNFSMISPFFQYLVQLPSKIEILCFSDHGWIWATRN